MSFEDYDFDFKFNLNFTHRTRCPHCKTSMVVIDNKVLSCPLCELTRREKKSELEKKRAVFPELC